MEETDILICSMLLKKLGRETVQKILEGELVTTVNHKKGFENDRYYRNLGDSELNDRSKKDVFDSYGTRVDPVHILQALGEAGDHFSYSNWHERHFEVVSEVLYRYCAEHGIPVVDHNGKP